MLIVSNFPEHKGLANNILLFILGDSDSDSQSAETSTDNDTATETDDEKSATPTDNESDSDSQSAETSTDNDTATETDDEKSATVAKCHVTGDDDAVASKACAADTATCSGYGFF